jgi:hypothetical protein
MAAAFLNIARLPHHGVDAIDASSCDKFNYKPPPKNVDPRVLL